mgnify:CR=1 FL=1
MVRWGAANVPLLPALPRLWHVAAPSPCTRVPTGGTRLQEGPTGTVVAFNAASAARSAGGAGGNGILFIEPGVDITNPDTLTPEIFKGVTQVGGLDGGVGTDECVVACWVMLPWLQGRACERLYAHLHGRVCNKVQLPSVGSDACCWSCFRAPCKLSPTPGKMCMHLQLLTSLFLVAVRRW